MATKEPLYMGFDLSTQQLKVLVVKSNLDPVIQEAVSFDDDLPHYGVRKGVFVNENDDEVYAPVAMWLEALDLVLTKLKERGFDFGAVKGISGAGQQHGSVYWSESAESVLSSLSPSTSLLSQLSPTAFSWPYAPNWQDHSTSVQVTAFEAALGGAENLAKATGSGGHHRFTGPQILRFVTLHPTEYSKTSRISLVSSFLASLLLGKIAPIDISDVCGMNLFNIETESWDETLISLAASPSGMDPTATAALYKKLGEVEPDGGANLGPVSPYFVQKYGFSPSCAIIPHTGDNPSTILALPLHAQDAIVSLGTSTTILMSTEKYYPSSAYHMFNHPTTPGLYMFMLCYKNGGLAREEIRDAINNAENSSSSSSTVDNPDKEKAIINPSTWSLFNKAALTSPPLGKATPFSPAHVGFYFPLPEIVPNVKSPGFYRFTITPSSSSHHGTSATTTTSTGASTESALEISTDTSSWQIPASDARAILESQALSMRIRSQPLLPPANPQPRRVYLVGGGSRNIAITRVLSEVLGGVEGVYTLDVGNACALGAAYKALWAVERRSKEEKFDDLIGERWGEQGRVERVAEGYVKGVWEEYGKVLPGYVEAEGRVVRGEVVGDVSAL